MAEEQYKLAFSFGQDRLFEVLSDKLENYIPRADVSLVLDDLREEVYSYTGDDSIREVHSIIKNCKKCPNLVLDRALPAWNKTDPDIVLINERPTVSKEEGQLLVKGLQKAGFKSTLAGMTFVNRCSTKGNAKYSQEEVSNCSSFLFTELQLLRPKLIVPLGLAATQVLLGGDLQLKDVKGKICWLGPWAIMPSFSPAYILRAEGGAADSFNADLQVAHKFIYGENDK